MKSIILKRHYLIRDEGVRVLIEHSPSLLGDKIRKIKTYSKKEIASIVSQTLPSLLKSISQDKLMKNVWGNTPKEIQIDLLISYNYHQQQNHKKVLNVQTQNWEKVTFFKQAHSLLIKERYDFFHPRTAIKAFARTIGKHQKNLRFNNIHLATDKINKQLIHQIHWDIESPNSPKKSIKHFVFDGILG